MKRICTLLILSVFAGHAFCQDIVINGTNKNRLLTWEDFTGKPEKSSSFEAHTYWKLNYSFTGVNFKNDTAVITGLNVKLQLDENLSWIKKGKETPALLKHEQGHFDIGILCQNEIIQQFKSTVFLRSDFQNKMQSIFSATLKKYNLMGLQYDEETGHSKNKENQEKWDAFFAKEINR